MHITLQNDLKEVERLAKAVETFIQENGLKKEQIFPINLALEEAVTNIISYGNIQNSTIAITFTLKGDELKITVEDRGQPFNPLETSEPDISEDDVDQRSVGGLGIHLIKNMMDAVSYQRQTDTNVLIMTKNIE